MRLFRELTSRLSAEFDQHGTEACLRRFLTVSVTGTPWHVAVTDVPVRLLGTQKPCCLIVLIRSKFSGVPTGKF
jgi:hypothetical protein